MYLLEPYDKALQEILNRGLKKKNRTGVDTLALFGVTCRYQINDSWPLVTGRKLYHKAVLAELLWFISGSTNNNKLKEFGANFWTPWVDENFETKHHFEPGSLGPVYGFQLRHFNGKYNKGIENEAYGFNGVDQLQNIIDLIKKDPESRRLFWSLWNPCQIDEMRLPPCHLSFQLDVTDGKLSGLLYQRSNDVPVGVPYNIAFYSAMLYLIAQQTGLIAYELVHVMADAHIYMNQMEAVAEYLNAEKPDSPQLKIAPADDIDSYTIDNFEVINYNPGPAIKFPVAV